MTFQMGLPQELITTLFTLALDELCLFHIFNKSKLVLLPQWYSLSCLFKLFSFENVLLQAWWTTYLSVLWMWFCFAKWLEEEDWNSHKSQATINSMLKSGSTSCEDEGCISAETSSWTSECNPGYLQWQDICFVRHFMIITSQISTCSTSLVGIQYIFHYVIFAIIFSHSQNLLDT